MDSSVAHDGAAWHTAFLAATDDSATSRLRRGKLSQLLRRGKLSQLLRRGKLAAVARGTVSACAAGQYTPSSQCEPGVVILPRIGSASVLYGEGGQVAPWDGGKPLTSDPRAAVQVVNKDCVDAAIGLAASGFQPALLNMANATRPGGGWRSGASAQEEELFRRSNMHSTVTSSHYPLPEFGCIYTPAALYFRHGARQGYAFMPSPVPLGTISCAAYVQPTTRGSRLAAAEEAGTRHKIAAIFSAAVCQGHDSLVLGALGCGSFGNPPDAIASYFREAAETYASSFKLILFAIIDDDAAARNGASNFDAFERQFRTWSPS